MKTFHNPWPRSGVIRFKHQTRWGKLGATCCGRIAVKSGLPNKLCFSNQIDVCTILYLVSIQSSRQRWILAVYRLYPPYSKRDPTQYTCLAKDCNSLLALYFSKDQMQVKELHPSITILWFSATSFTHCSSLLKLVQPGSSWLRRDLGILQKRLLASMNPDI